MEPSMELQIRFWKIWLPADGLQNYNKQFFFQQDILACLGYYKLLGVDKKAVQRKSWKVPGINAMKKMNIWEN